MIITNQFDQFQPTEAAIDPDKTLRGPRITSGSGVRGLYGAQNDLAPVDAFNVAVDGYLYARIQLTSAANGFPGFRDARIVCGRDPRPTGEAVRQALFTGIDVGLSCVNAALDASERISLTVYDVGINATPIVQNAVRHFDAHGGFIITASHNPVPWNGYKFLTANRESGDPYSQRGSLLSFPRMADFKDQRARFLHSLGSGDAAAREVSDAIIESGRKLSYTYESNGIPEQAVDSYFGYLRKMVGLSDDSDLDNFINQARDANFPIVVDHNGGAAKDTTAALLSRFGLRVIEIGDELGVPTHEIEPMDGALDAAKAALRELGDGFAIVHDFDADRGTLVILGDDGPADLSPQYTCSLNVYASIDQYIPILKSKSDANSRPISVVVNGNTSGSARVIANRFEKEDNVDVDIVEVETGEVNVVERMEELRRTGTGIPVIGVEGSCGGVIFGGDTESATSRDGALTALMAAKLMISTGNSLNAIIKELPLFHTPFKSIPGITAAPIDIKTALQEEFERRICKNENGTFTVSGVDGKQYGSYKIVHYIRTRMLDTMGEDTNGGYKIRLTDTDGNESFLWYRDSKTEPEIYIETDSTDKAESQALYRILEDVVMRVNAASSKAS